MSVNATELTNLCSIFIKLRTNKLPIQELGDIIESSLLKNSYANPKEIIVESIEANLIAQSDPYFYLTDIGKKIGKAQKEPAITLSEPAKDAFIKNILLNKELNKWCCSDFILKLQIDTIRKTFVFYRTRQETNRDLFWLKTLSQVNLAYSENNIFIINNKYLDLINIFLKEIRGIETSISYSEDNLRNMIGDLAENIAIDYEKTRLKKLGFPELSSLVQQISIVDRSAGYDILSFSCDELSSEENRFIEVKGTIKNNIQFIWSRNERNVAKRLNTKYFLYCFYNCDLSDNSATGPVIIQDPINNLESFNLRIEPLDVFVTTNYSNKVERK